MELGGIQGYIWYSLILNPSFVGTTFRVKHLMIGYMLGDQGVRACVILVLHERTWNAPVVSLVLPAFGDTGSLGSPPRLVVYPLGSTLGNCLPFPCGG